MKPLTLSIVSFLLPSVALAGGDVPLPFSFTSPGGNIADDRISFFDLTMALPSDQPIASIQLDLIGLSHETPMDLDIYLISPFGRTIEVMTDRGGQNDVTNITLNFADTGGSLPTPPNALTGGSYRPEGLAEGSDLGMGAFVGSPGVGSSPWKLVVSDDDPTGTGEFTAWTLRGTYVPEPISATLLAISALVAIRRPRR